MAVLLELQEEELRIVNLASEGMGCVWGVGAVRETAPFPPPRPQQLSGCEALLSSREGGRKRTLATYHCKQMGSGRFTLMPFGALLVWSFYLEDFSNGVMGLERGGKSSPCLKAQVVIKKGAGVLRELLRFLLALARIIGAAGGEGRMGERVCFVYYSVRMAKCFLSDNPFKLSRTGKGT